MRKMALCLCVLLLPALAMAKISVDISGDMSSPKSMKVVMTGEDSAIITDTERDSFKLSDSNLKSGAELYFGQWPADVYLHSPTPWGDLYSSYGYEQVRTTLKPIKSRVLSISNQPTVVKKQIFENLSTKSATFNVGIHQDVEDSVSDSWSREEQLSVGQDIEYGFDIEVVEAGGTTSMSYTSSWGKSGEKSRAVTVGTSSGIEVMLDPRQSVLVELQATRGVMQIEVEYEASVDGKVAVNYANPHKGHHFYGLSLYEVMKAAGLSTKIVSKQVIEVGFYSDGKIVVKDQQIGNHILSVNIANTIHKVSK